MARNKYAGYCYCCGSWVEPGYGHFEKVHDHSQKGKWRIKCVQCASGRKVSLNDPCVQRAQRGFTTAKQERNKGRRYGCLQNE